MCNLNSTHNIKYNHVNSIDLLKRAKTYKIAQKKLSYANFHPVNYGLCHIAKLKITFFLHTASDSFLSARQFLKSAVSQPLLPLRCAVLRSIENNLASKSP